MFTDGFLMSADFYRVQDKNIFSGHNTRTLLYLDFWHNAWFIRYTFLLQYLSNISETPYNITFCSLACVTYFNKREKMKSTAISYEKVNFDHTMSDVWNSSDPFVYTMHTTCGMTLKTLGEKGQARMARDSVRYLNATGVFLWKEHITAQ